MKPRVRISGSLAAMALLLAACGGGGGSDNGATAVSASPGTPEKAGIGISEGTATASSHDMPSVQTSNNSARGTSGTGGASGISSPTRDTGATSPATQPQPQPQPVDSDAVPTVPVADGGTTSPARAATPPDPAPVAPISAQGVRGDVLLTMLDQKSCNPFGVLSASHDGPRLDNDADFPPPWISHGISADNYQTNPEYRSAVEHTPVPGALCPPLIIYSPVPAGVYAYGVNSSVYGRFTSPDSRPRGFSMLNTSIPVAVSQDAIILGDRIEATANAYWGKTFRDQNPDGQPRDGEHSFGRSGSSKTIGLNGLVPVGVLSTWTDESHGDDPYTMTTQMLLLPGSHARQAKLCIDTYMKYVKRLHCTVWSVPENWKRGMELKDDGQYIVDDRSTYPGESGLLYWRTSGRD